MKKNMISFFVLLFLIILAISLFFILNHSLKNEDQETSAASSGVQATIAPTLAVTPSISPEPTQQPQSAAQIFPVSQMIDNEIKYGYIDKTGSFVIDPCFDMASDFHDGVAVVTIDSHYCVIDENGGVVYTSKDPIRDFSNGAAVITDSSQGDNLVYGYIDTHGKVIITPTYIQASDFNKDNTAYVSKEAGQYTVIDKSGKVLGSYELDKKYDSFWGIQDGYIIYANSDSTKYGVISVKGDQILKQKYSEIRYLGNDLFAVKEPGLDMYDSIMAAKSAIFNQKGEQLTDYCLYDVSNYYDGYASATDDTSTFIIGPDGVKVTSFPEFEGAGTLTVLGDVIEANIDNQLFYCTMDKTIIWQEDDTYQLSDTITVNTLKFKPNRNVCVYYPEIKGLADPTVQGSINQALKSIFTDSRSTVKVEDLISIEDSFKASLINNLLIIERDGYDYGFGAAHGMPIMEFSYINIKTGVFYKLEDLFIEGSDYGAAINKMITDEINSRMTSEDSMFFPDSFVGIAKDQYFKLDQNAITFYFTPYEIAPYAAGFPEFMIPFSDIDEYINKTGDFWNTFNGTN